MRAYPSTISSDSETDEKRPRMTEQKTLQQGAEVKDEAYADISWVIDRFSYDSDEPHIPSAPTLSPRILHCPVL